MIINIEPDEDVARSIAGTMLLLPDAEARNDFWLQVEQRLIENVIAHGALTRVQAQAYANEAHIKVTEHLMKLLVDNHHGGGSA